MQITITRHGLSVAAGVLMLAAWPEFALGRPPVAEAFDWSVRAGANRSDNIGRTAVDEQSDTALEAGLALNLHDRRPRLQSDVAADLSYRDHSDYRDDSGAGFDSEVVGSLTGALLFAVVPERFSWTVQDYFGQIANDVRAVETPANRQNLNTFTTGPDFNFPLSARTFAQLGARASDVDYETTPADHRRYSGTAGLLRNLSRNSSVSLNVSSAKIRYDQAPAGADYDVQEGFLGVEAAGLRTTLSLHAGYTVLERAERQGGALLRAEVSRKVGARSTLELGFGREFSDAAGVFQLDLNFTGVQPGNIDAAASADPFRSDYAQFSWSTTGGRTDFGVFTQWRQERHDTQATLDRRVKSAGADLSRHFSPRLTGHVHVAQTRDDFSGATVDRRETVLGAALDWQVRSNLSLQLRADRARGNGAVANTSDYEENRLYAGLTYSRGR